ncbi:Interferon regulatory factor 3, partial [Acanthisitta chloris]
QRRRFVPWLLSAIDSGTYRGLRWTDATRSAFRVPWKHNARKDITSSDLEVFKAWAQVSGKYEECAEDPAKWKTNFRCALRSTHMFHLVDDNSKCGDDPHKVFSIVSGEPGPMVGLRWVGVGNLRMPHPDALLSDPTLPLSLEELLQRCNISPPSSTPSWLPAGDTLHQEVLLQLHQDTLLQPQVDCLPPTALQEWMPVVEQPTLGTYTAPNLVPPEELAGAMPLPCHQTEVMGPMPPPGEVMFLTPAPNPVPPPPPDHMGGNIYTLDITIYYRGKEFHREVVEGSPCLLTYPSSNPRVYQWPRHVVHFPSPASVADGKQRHYTENLLRSVGLQLELRDFKVFATRLQKCKVFWALSQQLEDPPHNVLCRDQATPIFDFHEFCTELRDFRNGQRRRSPDFTIYLCFGQCFSKAKPKDTKLILVKLVPKFCESWHQQVLQEGASSLDSGTMSLQLSDSFSLYELIEQYNMELD